MFVKLVNRLTPEIMVPVRNPCMLMVPPQPGQHEKLVGIFCYPERVNKTLGKLLGSHTYTDKTRYGLYLVGKMLRNNFPCTKTSCSFFRFSEADFRRYSLRKKQEGTNEHNVPVGNFLLYRK